MTGRVTAAVFLLLCAAVSVAADSRHFDADGVSLRYFVAGHGETVVLLHGFGGSATGLYLEPGTFAALVDAGYRVVALDQRGHGDSDKPDDPDSYGLQMVEDVRRLLDHLGVQRVHLVGYSMGAKVTNAFRDRYPERLMSITLGGYGWPWPWQESTLEEARAALQQRMVAPGNDVDALAAVSVAGQALAVTAPSLRANRVPAFAIIGNADEVVPREDFETLQGTMANLDVLVVPGTHAGPDGAPYKPAYRDGLIDFLARQP